MSSYAETPQHHHAPLQTSRPLYWSIRREVWENRSVYLAPLVVAGIVLFGCFLATIVAGAQARKTGKPAGIIMPMSSAPAPIMLATFVVGFIYSMDALYGERRDRSILFWKSLPVSDRTTVLSKAAIPLVVLPVIALALSAATQIILLPITIAVSLGAGGGGELWRLLPEPVVMVYGMTVHALWFAPIYCWLLVVSAWAKRAPLLWAVLPAMIIAGIEKMIFKTWYFMNMLQYRMTGAMREAFGQDLNKHQTFTDLTPINFLLTPGLWVGLIFAAACLVAAVRLRRNREPI